MYVTLYLARGKQQVHINKHIFNTFLIFSLIYLRFGFKISA